MNSSGPGKIDKSQLTAYILDYVKCDSVAEATAILDEAEAGNPAAQYIVAMALEEAGRKGSDEWMHAAAAQGFRPALIKLRRMSANAERQLPVASGQTGNVPKVRQSPASSTTPITRRK